MGGIVRNKRNPPKHYHRERTKTTIKWSKLRFTKVQLSEWRAVLLTFTFCFIYVMIRISPYGDLVYLPFIGKYRVGRAGNCYSSATLVSMLWSARNRKYYSERPILINVTLRCILYRHFNLWPSAWHCSCSNYIV